MAGLSRLKPYPCPFCPEGFDTANALGTHKRKCKNRVAAHAQSYSKRKAGAEEIAEAAKRAREDEELIIARTRTTRPVKPQATRDSSDEEPEGSLGASAHSSSSSDALSYVTDVPAALQHSSLEEPEADEPEEDEEDGADFDDVYFIDPDEDGELEWGDLYDFVPDAAEDNETDDDEDDEIVDLDDYNTFGYAQL